ncbi:putative 1-aminocyclopropane-1-carboxylate oxidase [Aspergillus cavernicola]|uniref:1-aminocyclopropane-1-carboxylate oxidase n=1 Tax=Aspergillus cavernicola TaxID=176166 RepID=A0ABR4I502_9EURO
MTMEAPQLAYVQVPETSQNLDWADLRTLDLSKFDQPGGKQELAAELTKAIEDVGFFYVTNYGLSKEEVDGQFALAKTVLSLPNDEKQKYRAALEQGDYNGWKPASTRNLVPGVKDNFEIYNIPKFTPEHASRAHPEIVKQHWQSIQKFSQHIHDHIVQRLLTIFAVALGLDDDQWLVNKHRYEQSSGDHLRYMKYYARSEQENEKLGGVWLKGHSDMGSLTLLFRQPVAALQVLTKTGEWKYVRPQMDALTVNIADALQFLTDGYLKSSIHRVVAPPKDQAHIDRLGVLYMVRIEDDCDLVPIKESPVLRQHGLIENKILGSDGLPLKAGEWVKQRVIRNLGQSTGEEGDNEVNDVEILKGVKVQYFD